MAYIKRTSHAINNPRWGGEVTCVLPRVDANIMNPCLVIRAPDFVWTRADLRGVQAKLIIAGNCIMTTDAEYSASIWADTVRLPCFVPDTDLPLFKMEFNQVQCTVQLPNMPTHVQDPYCSLVFEGDNSQDLVQQYCEERDTMPTFLPLVHPDGGRTELKMHRGMTSVPIVS